MSEATLATFLFTHWNSHQVSSFNKTKYTKEEEKNFTAHRGIFLAQLISMVIKYNSKKAWADLYSQVLTPWFFSLCTFSHKTGLMLAMHTGRGGQNRIMHHNKYACTHTHTHTHTHTYKPHTHMHKQTHTHAYAQAHTHTQAPHSPTPPPPHTHTYTCHTHKQKTGSNSDHKSA